MSAGIPELGSKISLISKADIRYEGRLYTVDPQKCTIALANVKSFGTEDRETQFTVAPQCQVYEYILFRGSDIKDIIVDNSVCSIANDPAIVHMTVQPPVGQQSYDQPQPSYGHPMMGPMGNQFGPYLPIGGMGPLMGMRPQNQQPMGKTSSVLDMISGGSRSTTPSSLLARKSPTIDQGVQTGQQQSNNIGKIGDKQNMRNVQQHRDRFIPRSHGSGRASGMSQYNEGKPHQQHKDMMHGHNQNMRNQNQRGQGGWQMQQRGGPMRGGRGAGGGSGGGGGGLNNRAPRPNNFRNQQLGAPKPKNRLKFENDYDFEQANTEFEELRSQLSKVKIDGVEIEKKDDSGNETGAGDNEPEEEHPEIVHYDRAKSFFDNISCEAVERSKGRSQRTDWRTERKLNSETFGVASMRRGGGFRGRGYGYNNRNMGGNMYRNNQPGGGNQNYNRGGYRNQRGGGNQHKNPNQLGNAMGSTSGTGNQSNRNTTSNITTNPSEQSSSTSATTSAATPTQQTGRLVTGTA